MVRMKISHEDEDDFLQEIELSKTVVRMTTNHHHYLLNVRAVGTDELEEAKKILKRFISTIG